MTGLAPRETTSLQPVGGTAGGKGYKEGGGGAVGREAIVQMAAAEMPPPPSGWTFGQGQKIPRPPAPPHTAKGSTGSCFVPTLPHGHVPKRAESSC